MAVTKQDPRAVFDRAAAATRERSPATFDQWFGGVQFDDLTDGVLTLRAQNEFVMDWVKTNFLPELLDQIHRNAGWSVQVSWILDAKLDRPISRGQVASPVRPRALRVEGDDPHLPTTSTRATPSRTSSSARPTSSRTRPRSARPAAAGGATTRCFSAVARASARRTSSTRSRTASTKSAPRAHPLRLGREVRERVRHRLQQADGRVSHALPRAAICSSSTTSSSSPRRRRRRRSSSTRSTRSTAPTSRSSSRATSTRSSSSGWRSGWSRASRGASSPTSRARARDARRDPAKEGRSSRDRARRRGRGLPRADHPVERSRARGHAHPPRREVVAHRPRVDIDFARQELARPRCPPPARPASTTSSASCAITSSSARAI
jgi:hypothetical protein